MFTPTLNKKASQFTERLVFVDVDLVEQNPNQELEELKVLCSLKALIEKG